MSCLLPPNRQGATDSCLFGTSNGWRRCWLEREHQQSKIITSRILPLCLPHRSWGTFPTIPVALANAPTVRTTGVGGTLNVAHYPQNNVASPDVTVNTSGAVNITVATANIPGNTTAKFFISTDIGNSDMTQSATVLGNPATLTNVTLPTGASHIFVPVTSLVFHLQYHDSGACTRPRSSTSLHACSVKFPGVDNLNSQAFVVPNIPRDQEQSRFQRSRRDDHVHYRAWASLRLGLCG